MCSEFDATTAKVVSIFRELRSQSGVVALNSAALARLSLEGILEELERTKKQLNE